MGADQAGPLWLRALLALDRAATRGAALVSALRDEAMFAWLTPADRERLTVVGWSGRRTYFPGGPVYEGGLFAWERAALTAPPFPGAGRVLLGGAGGGREVVGLRGLGYEVVAFEPNADMVAAARARLAEPGGGATVLCGSYADLVRAAAGGGGPLAAVPGAGPYDAIVLGWQSFPHVLERPAREALLRALRTLAPAAPVLLSYFPARATPDVPTGARRAARRLFAQMGAPSAAEPADGYQPWIGFFRTMSRAELAALAAATGYRVFDGRGEAEGYAVLVPGGAS